jgi:hypothetical protein
VDHVKDGRKALGTGGGDHMDHMYKWWIEGQEVA